VFKSNIRKKKQQVFFYGLNRLENPARTGTSSNLPCGHVIKRQHNFGVAAKERFKKFSKKTLRMFQNETSFSRLRTQGPQTPGKLHELKNLYRSTKKIKHRAPVLFPKRVHERVLLSVNAARHSFVTNLLFSLQKKTINV